MAKLKIQFVSANTLASALLQIEREKRDIQLALGSKAIVFHTPAVRVADLMEDLRTNGPNVVHISAHGTPFHELLFLNEADRPKAIPREAIVELFKLHKKSIRLVVLSACYSLRLATELAQFIDYVIGVSHQIPDESARRYCVHLYRRLSAGDAVEDAHVEAEILMRADRLGRGGKPRLVKRNDSNTRPLVMKSSSGTDQLAQARRTLDTDDDLQTTIAILRREQALSRSEKQRLDKFQMRNLPAFLEGVWQLAKKSRKRGGALEIGKLYDNFAPEVKLCDNSNVLWSGERPPKSPAWWSDFRELAAAISVEDKRRAMNAVLLRSTTASQSSRTPRSSPVPTS